METDRASVEKSAERIFKVLEQELEHASASHAKAVIAAVLIKMRTATVPRSHGSLTVQAMSAVELIARLLDLAETASKRSRVSLSSEAEKAIEKLKGIRDTISQTNQVTPKQLGALMSASSILKREVRRLKC